MPTLTKQPKKRAESTILSEIRRWAGTQPNLSLYRNNVGKLKDSTGRWVTYGLCVGSADLIGWLRCHVKPVPFRGVSCAVARFVALEVKLPGQKARPEQEAWLRLVRDAGGIAGVVTSVDEAEALLVDARAWL
jgi:hypothetical protein